MASEDYTDPDVAALTASEIERARPIVQLHKQEIVDLLVRRRGRPASDPLHHKRAISIRIDPDILAFYKAEGPGWQTLINGVLRSQMDDTVGAADLILAKAMASQRQLATEKAFRSDA